MFHFFTFIASLIFPLSPLKPATQERTLAAKTVIFIETKLYHLNKNDEFDEIPSIPLRLRIYYSPDRDWKKINKPIAEYEKVGSFFFTAPETSYYKFELYVDEKYYKSLTKSPRKIKNDEDDTTLSSTEDEFFGVDMTIYEGTASVPRIVSAIDSTLNNAKLSIYRAIDVCREIDELQKLDMNNDQLHWKYLIQNYYIVVLSIALKLFFVVTFHYYFNKDVMNYFVQRKIGR
ncbi:hypothetical protein DMUE_0875 [Dictyocoela muelleri]|nr:hypothetical protein DMUE_0875 [Dictyocoela muelleri]